MLQRWMVALAFIFVLASGTLARAAEGEEPKAEPEKKSEPEKKAEETKAEAASEKPADPNDPKVVSGLLPVFPLVSEKFESIHDGYDEAADNFDRDRNEMEMPYGAMEDIMVALRGSPQEHLLKNVDEEATFRKLMKTPEKFRGHVVKLVGILADTQGGPRNRDFFHEGYPATPNLSGFARVYKGQTTNANGEIITFRSMEPPPADLKPGEAIQLVGIFMGRYCYLNRDPGNKLTWTPLIFVRRVERYAMKPISSTNNPMTNTAAIIVFLFIGAGAAAYFYSRMKYKTAAANHFTRMKLEKDEGTGNYFPRKTPKKPAPKKKPDEKKSEGSDQKKDDPPATSGEQSAPA